MNLPQAFHSRLNSKGEHHPDGADTVQHRMKQISVHPAAIHSAALAHSLHKRNYRL